MKKFTNVRLKGKKELVSILVEDGKIKKIATELKTMLENEQQFIGFKARHRYRTMANALQNSGRDIVLGICEWGQRQ